MHHAEDVGETGMFRRRINPPCRLQLVDIPQPLHPGMIDDLAFRHFLRLIGRRGSKRDVTMQRIVAEVVAVFVHG